MRSQRRDCSPLAAVVIVAAMIAAVLILAYVAR